MLSQRFKMPEKYDPQTMFGDQFGIRWKEKKHEVRILFTPRAAPYIAERQWHPLQQIEERKNGSIVLEFTTNHLDEVGEWVLSWGAEAKVLAPDELVKHVKGQLRKALGGYG